MDHEKGPHGQMELEQLSVWLQEDGLPPDASPEERQRHLWQQLLNSEAKLQASTKELQNLRTQQAHEMKEVESYVAHIRGLTAGYERDNEQLRQELHQIRQQQESQSKELAEMLAQEDLGEMGLSSPSEQVAYLLVERATLLERLDAAERRLDSQSLTGSLKDGQLQAHSEEISRERNERQRLERDLEEAASRLAMAHQDIRRLNNELDVAKSSNLDLDDKMKLQRAKEQNDRINAENRGLRERVCTLEREKKNLHEQLAKTDTDRDAVQEDQRDKSISNEQQKNLSVTLVQEKEFNHKRCQSAMEDRLVQIRELERQLHRLRAEQGELEERNEELEALLGEAQNAAKEERHRHEGELEGLHRQIKSLEAELKKQDTQEKLFKNGEEIKTTESYLQLHLRDSNQERLALLEARLTEEKDWRKQLELDLSAAQAALKKDKEALQIGERELKKLRLEVNSLQTECQQGKTLIKSLNQVKGEKALLEEKVAQMERAYRRLQSELEHYKTIDQTPGDRQENKLQVDQLQGQADRLTKELSSLQAMHKTLRDELASERQQTAELQAKLNSSVQQKLVAEGEKGKMDFEKQQLKQQLQWHQEQLSITKEALSNYQKAANTEFRHSSVEKTSEKGLDQLSCLKQELNDQKTKLIEEQQLASNHQLALQAQVNEAQAHVKCQDLVLSQKTEEAKQMKEDLQRVQNLFTSAERELRYEKEKNMDLKRHNTLLDNEKLKLCAELNQVQTKLVQLEKSVHSQTANSERQQQKIRELELELAHNSVNRSTAACLQEELQAERTRLIDVDKKVLELQQQLKATQHQLRMEEARAGDSSRLERDSRDLSDTLSALRAQQQEDRITRKLTEQREEELQQQVRTLRLKEASLNRTNAELNHRAQQLETRLSIMEAELSKSREEAKESQTTSHRLKQDLAVNQQECNKLEGELQQVLLQLDTHIRKYNEKHSQNKMKLRQAKQVFLKTTTQKDSTIQKLENDLALAASLSHKEKEMIHKVMEENEKLLEERRALLLKISEAEEMGSNGMRTASTVQHRVNILEVENRQLQDRTLKLSNQVSVLERALRNVQSFYSLENVKKVLPSDGLCDNILQASTFSSLSSGSYEPLDFLDTICHVADSSQAPVSTQQPSEQGYLNLNSPLVSPNNKGSKESPNGDEVV